MRNKQVMLGILSYLQKVWETCGVQSSACPSIKEADRGLAFTESGEAQQVAGYLLGPHGTLRNQLGKLGLSASRQVVLIKGWAGSGRLFLGLPWPVEGRCSWAGVPELCEVCRHQLRENLAWCESQTTSWASHPNSWPGTCWSELFHDQR